MKLTMRDKENHAADLARVSMGMETQMEEYRKMGMCEKLFCSHKSCPAAALDIIGDCLCGVLCGYTPNTKKPVLSAEAPAAAAPAAAAAVGDAK